MMRPTTLTTARHDRAAGALLGTAVGDALGVPYEFTAPPAPHEPARMTGGGLGGFAPGEWSDDTAMAIAIARVAATGGDLTTQEALDQVAAGFLEWYRSNPADIGNQTAAVLRATHDRVRGGDDANLAEVMRGEARRFSVRHPHSAGNGALMRTAPVALAHLHDRDSLSDAARKVAELTHADPLAADACVLWCEAIRVAIMEARIDVAAGLDLLPRVRRDRWTDWIADATDVERNQTEPVPGARFSPNGYTVTALQAAIAAIVTTPVPLGVECLHLQHALHAAVRIGNDTDTVAAIAGGLVGARWGASAIPWAWRRAVHGWPGYDAIDLVQLATLTASRGRTDAKGWPGVAEVPYDEPASRVVVPHPFDDGVLLGTHASAGHTVEAVVSMCRVGRQQSCLAGAVEVIQSRLMDSEDPAANPNLVFSLYDAADAVRGLRQEGKRVLLHCVAAQQRTPTVAVAYALLLGHDLNTARAAVLDVLPSARGRGHVWDGTAELAQRVRSGDFS